LESAIAVTVRHADPMSDRVIREAKDDEVEACVGLWVHACTVRDGVAVAGVAERARAKFDRRVVWLVSDAEGRTDGFALVTAPGTGAVDDPADAVVLGLLAVAPDVQGAGLGRRLLGATADVLAARGYDRAVLHVLADNAAAVRLYESEGWEPSGEPFEHALLHRFAQTYVLNL
jgi:ribosomal protein S18 acetylase RimI-like enzyme